VSARNPSFYFRNTFVKTGLISTDAARALPRAFGKRHTTNYGDFSEPTWDEVLSLRDQVQALVASCEELVRNG